MRPRRILHIETGRHLYGGAQQVLYLLEGLQQDATLENHLLCVADSAIAAAAQPFCQQLHILPMRGDWDLRFYPRLKALLCTLRPDLVHVHSRRGADWWGGLAARALGIPAVLSRRVDHPETALSRYKYRFYARTITISRAIYQILQDAGVAPQRLVCVPSAVDTTRYQQPCERDWFLREFNLPETALCLGVIAQLIERKGHRHLLAALPEILRTHPDAYALFFGQGPLAHTLQAQATAQGLNQRIIFAGFRQDLQKILPCLDLVVHPADKEGLGVALLQAASAGRAIVATEAGGLPEVVGADNGLLIPPANPHALAHAVNTLLADPPRRTAMGQRGRQHVSEHFSITAMVAGNRAVYQEILDCNR